MYSLSYFIFSGPADEPPGFTLLELLVVMIIVCLLAVGVVFMYINPTAKVKTAAFGLLTDLNLARSEAVNRNRDVLIDFTIGARDGYLLCLDTDGDKDCHNEAAADIIKEVLFRKEVRFYDCPAAPPFPAGGPATTPAGTTLAGKNGLIFGGPDYIRWQPDGTSSDNGSIIMYHPAFDNRLRTLGDAYAAVISSAATGRIRLMRYRRDTGWAMK